MPLEPFGICNMERCATLRTPTGFLTEDRPVPGQPFDSGSPGCAWHRLLVDADIPNGCTITVGARAADEPALLERLPFVRQPVPYLRSTAGGDAGGAELPWHDPWADVVRPTSGRTGTWELLFQHVTGRYVQLEVHLTGTGRTTPALRALRAWFPRFSYVHAYLPEAYQEDDEPGRFLERLLPTRGLLTIRSAHRERLVLATPGRRHPGSPCWLVDGCGSSRVVDGARRFLLTRPPPLPSGHRAACGPCAPHLGCSLAPDGPGPAAPARRPRPHVGQWRAPRFKALLPFALDEEQPPWCAHLRGALPAPPASRCAGHRFSSWAKPSWARHPRLQPLFVPFDIGATPLAAGVLAADHPFEVADRLVSDRDRLGELPGL